MDFFGKVMSMKAGCYEYTTYSNQREKFKFMNFFHLKIENKNCTTNFQFLFGGTLKPENGK